MIINLAIASIIEPAPAWYLIFIAICRGLFIVGILVFLIELLFSGLNLLDHGHEIDKTLDHDVSADHDISVDHDHDFHFDKKDFGESSAPLLLLIAAFSLSTGFLGVFIDPKLLDSYFFHFLITILIPIEVVWLTSKLWKKIASDFLHPLPKVSFGSTAKTLTDIDQKGGLILVNASTNDVDSSIKQVKKPAKTNGVLIKRNTTVYILGKENNFFIVSKQIKPKAKEWEED